MDGAGGAGWRQVRRLRSTWNSSHQLELYVRGQEQLLDIHISTGLGRWDRLESVCVQKDGEEGAGSYTGRGVPVNEASYSLLNSGNAAMSVK